MLTPLVGLDTGVSCRSLAFLDEPPSISTADLRYQARSTWSSDYYNWCLSVRIESSLLSTVVACNMRWRRSAATSACWLSNADRGALSARDECSSCFISVSIDARMSTRQGFTSSLSSFSALISAFNNSDDATTARLAASILRAIPLGGLKLALFLVSCILR